jgi:hypothetical protein
VTVVRLRQVALVARDLEPVVGDLQRELGLEETEPFRDPGIIAFGLQNAVMAVGDTFLEVVSPVQPDTTAGRYLERRGGDGGYMAIFQVADLTAARERIAASGVRVVWQSDHPDIAGTHLHPKDVPGALVSIDWASPAGSWRWAGPNWTAAVPDHPPGGIVGVTVQSERPMEVARRWGEVLGCEPHGVDDGAAIDVDGGVVRFVPLRDERGEGICGFEVAIPEARSREMDLGGVRVVVEPARS